MAKHYNGPWILRTLLFTPGHNEKLIGKALNSEADCVVLDLEDAVPENCKQKAREVIRETLTTKKPDNLMVMVRINPLESGLTLLDLDEVACRQLDGIIFPKAYCADDIKALDAQLSLKEKTLSLETGHFNIIILIETPRSVLNCLEMATASKRVIGLLYGCEDYLTDMEGFHGPEGRSLLVPRHLTSMAARAAGIVPIDTPYVQVKDESGFEKHITQGRELGFEGVLVMTPKQIEIARRMYTPSQEDVKEARHIVTMASQASEDSRGIALAGNIFISPPTLKRAQKILKRLDAIENFENFRRRTVQTDETTNRLKLIKKAAETSAEIESEKVLA